MFSDKQIHMSMDTLVSFAIQSGQVSEGGAFSVSCHVNLVSFKHLATTSFKNNFFP